MDHVILLHGIWMRGFTLNRLASRLVDAGFSTEVVDYASVASGPDGVVDGLRERMSKSKAESVHLIGHSLGGLVALQAVDTDQPLPSGRVLCLGSPLVGSSAARGLQRWSGMSWMLGRSRDLLCSGRQPWTRPRQVGVIAGTRERGLGTWFGNFADAHDGTVSVAETRLDGIVDHYSLPVSHSGLVFSRGVATLAVGFLRNGSFPRETGQTG